jgi:rhodanese-related sulfurtransferase
MCRSGRIAAVLTAVGALVLAACTSVGPPPTSPSQTQTSSAARLVDPPEFAAKIAEPGRVTVNVHVPFEGDIAGTDLSIPFDQITAQAGRLPADRDTGLAIYCRSGPMSAIAAERLRDLGYTDVVELSGGMRAWQADGRQLIGI